MLFNFYLIIKKRRKIVNKMGGEDRETKRIDKTIINIVIKLLFNLVPGVSKFHLVLIHHHHLKRL